MKKGFVLPLIIVAVVILLVSTSVYLYFKFNKINNTQAPINDGTYNKSSPQSSSTPNEQASCTKNQVGDIKFQPPIGWKNVPYECNIFTAPGTEENYPFGTPENGAQLSVSNTQRLVTTDCKAIDNVTYLVPLECKILNGNKFAAYEINYEGFYLVYSLNYKGKDYEFRIGSGQRDKYKPVLDQIISNLEYL